MSRGRVRSFRFGDRGAVGVEFALVFPLMLAMFWASLR